jgi:ankyrin repeat protein
MQESRKAGKSGSQPQKPRLPDETLLEKSPKPQDYGQLLRTNALFNGALDGDIERIQQSIHDGANVNATDKDGQTPLHYAIKHGTPEACSALIENGADMELKDNHGSAALHHAANGGNARACAILISKGADVNAKDEDGNTPLHCAAWAGHIDVCALLIENGADMTAKDKKGWAPWRRAVWAEHPEVAGLLIFFNRMRRSLGQEGMVSFTKSFRECVGGA